MPDSVGKTLRREIAERAGGKCEYRLTPEWILLAGCEVDHVTSRKHEGITDPSNLAIACAWRAFLPSQGTFLSRKNR